MHVKGQGVRPIFLPFFSVSDVQKWKNKNYKFMHIGQIDIIVHPHFTYHLNAPYLVSLLDVRHLDWQKALVGQFTGNLDREGLCSIQPNFTFALDDPHLTNALVVCI